MIEFYVVRRAKYQYKREKLAWLISEYELVNDHVNHLDVQSGPIISKLIGFRSLCFQGGVSTVSQINA